MTMLLTVTSRHGMVLAADSRLTVRATARKPVDDRPKIIEWGSMYAAVGYAGLATLRTGTTYEVIKRIMMEERWASLGAFAVRLGDTLRRELPHNARGDDRRIYVHVVGYGAHAGDGLPEFHYVRNSEWESILNYFQVSEDLRFTHLRRLGVGTARQFERERRVLRVQFSGQRDLFYRRFRHRLFREARRMRSLDELGRWTARQIEGVAADPVAAGTVGGPLYICRLNPEGVVVDRRDVPFLANQRT